MYKLIYLISLIFVTDAFGNELQEFGCEAIYSESDSAEVKITFLSDFNMLDYNGDNEFIELSTSEEIQVKGIRCARSSIVPNNYDYMAVKAGYPFYILSDERVLVIEIINGQFRTRLLAGDNFSETEKNEIGKKLNFFQSEIQNESSQ